MIERTMAVGLLLLVGCGGGSTAGGGGGAGSGTGGGASGDLAMSAPHDGGSSGATASFTVAVPAGFSGAPRQLLVAAFDQFPVTGPPAGILYQGTPSLQAGQALALSGDASGLSGSKSVLAVLYMQGGGTFSPKPGVDYASAPATVDFTGAPVDVGTLTLVLVPAGDGGI